MLCKLKWPRAARRGRGGDDGLLLIHGGGMKGDGGVVGGGGGGGESGYEWVRVEWGCIRGFVEWHVFVSVFTASVV